MSNKTNASGELIDYAKKHLLSHMRAAGMSEEAIEAHIASMPSYHPLKSHFVGQFVESLPAEQRVEVTKRLLPPIVGEKMKITVLTAPDEPSFEVSANVSARYIDGIVLNAYGRQDDGRQHNWRGEPVETNE